MSVAYDEIRAALMVQLEAYQSVDVAWPNSKYVPVKGTGYLEPTVVPVDVEQGALGTSGTNKQTGVFEVLVWEPVGTGGGVITRKADEVVTQFKRGTDLTKNSTIVTCASASAGAIMQMGDWSFIPVTVSWYSFTVN